MNINQNISVDKFTGLPRIEYDDSNNILVFPFYVSLGAKKFIKNIDTFRRLFTGDSAVILRWEGAESYLRPDNIDLNIAKKLKRTYTLGSASIFRMKMLDNNFQTQWGSDELLGATSQSISKTFTLYTNNTFIWDEALKSINDYYLYFFYLIPELGETDFFYIRDCQVFLDQSGNYHHSEIVFSSIGDEFEKSGLALQQFINYGAPGEGYAYPLIQKKPKEVVVRKKTDSDNKPILDKDGNEQTETEWKIIKNVIFDENRRRNYPISSIQIEPLGGTLLSSVLVAGRPIEKVKDITKEEYKFVEQPRWLLISNFLPPNETAISKLLPQANNNYVYIDRAKLVNITADASWRQSVTIFSDPNKERADEGFLAFDDKDVKKLSQPAESKISKLKIGKVVNSNLGVKPTIIEANIKSLLYTSPYSDETYQIDNEYTLDDKGKKTYTPPKIKTKKFTGKSTLANILNMNAINYSNQNELSVQISEIVNYQPMVKSILNTAFTILGAFFGFKGYGSKGGGAAKGGLTDSLYGGFAGGQIESLLGWIMPSNWISIENVEIWANHFPLLMPATFFEKAKLIRKEWKGPINIYDQLIPMESLKPDGDNTLAALIRSDEYNTTLHFKISDQLANGGNTLDYKLGNKRIVNMDDLSALELKDSNTQGYAIDGLNVKMLGGKGFMVTMFHNNRPVWNGMYNSAAGYTGNLKKWSTEIITSDYDDDGYATRLKAWKSSLTQKFPPEKIETQTNVSSIAFKEIDEVDKVVNYSSGHTFVSNELPYFSKEKFEKIISVEKFSDLSFTTQGAIFDDKEENWKLAKKIGKEKGYLGYLLAGATKEGIDKYLETNPKSEVKAEVDDTAWESLRQVLLKYGVPVEKEFTIIWSNKGIVVKRKHKILLKLADGIKPKVTEVNVDKKLDLAITNTRAKIGKNTYTSAKKTISINLAKAISDYGVDNLQIDSSPFNYHIRTNESLKDVKLTYNGYAREKSWKGRKLGWGKWDILGNQPRNHNREIAQYYLAKTNPTAITGLGGGHAHHFGNFFYERTKTPISYSAKDSGTFQRFYVDLSDEKEQTFTLLSNLGGRDSARLELIAFDYEEHDDPKKWMISDDRTTLFNQFDNTHNISIKIHIKPKRINDKTINIEFWYTLSNTKTWISYPNKYFTFNSANDLFARLDSTLKLDIEKVKT